VPVSLRAVAAMVAWGMALAAALLFGCALPLALKLAGVLLLAACLWPATADLAGRRGRLELGNDADGRWWLRRGRSSPEYVQFGARPLVLGTASLGAARGAHSPSTVVLRNPGPCASK
jgi:hypothetical protein